MPKSIVRKSEKAEYPLGHPGRPSTPIKTEAPELLSNEDNPIDVDLIEGEPEEERCIIDHRTDGFDGQQAYVFRGSFKGKLVRVLAMSGRLVKAEFDSAIQGSGISFIQADYVFACVSCILDILLFADFRSASAHAHSEMEVNLLVKNRYQEYSQFV